MSVKVLSLFDGMSCGMLAMVGAGIEVERYVSYEIDKYAIETASHNFPIIEQMGDVFNADFKQYDGFDFLIGGSPCTYWSIAQTKNREKVASGVGWELFSQYVKALNESKPKYFIYENNKSMSKAIKDSIDKTFGFESILINSALVSAQNRNRLYWVGVRNADGTYSKADIKQPKDVGMTLSDILKESIDFRDNSTFPINITSDGKSQCIRATCYKDGIRNIAGNNIDKKTGVAVLVDADSFNNKHVYEVKNGEIIINGMRYNMRLSDGYYLIRKLTVEECMRLQTVPDWYEFPVSKTQAYKMLGNGWTVEVIIHIIKSIIY